MCAKHERSITKRPTWKAAKDRVRRGFRETHAKVEDTMHDLLHKNMEYGDGAPDQEERHMPEKGSSNDPQQKHRMRAAWAGPPLNRGYGNRGQEDPPRHEVK